MLTFTDLSCPAASADDLAPGSVDSQLWLACAGSMCTVPPVGAAVVYFPQGHAEQATAALDLSAALVPPLIPCRVAAVRFMADAHTDEVFAKIRLVPLRPGDAVVDVGPAAAHDDPRPSKPASFAKTLTQSDANNGGGFSVPRFCAETIFPALDYGDEPPVQNIFVRDVHGEEFKFRHIYRGTPRRHLLTTGWSNFVNQKKLLAGDSIVFLRSEAGEVHVGVRRAKRVFCTDDAHSGWDHYRGLTRGGNATSDAKGKVPAEDVVAAARLAAAGQPFEVVYYPRASTPEFCVRASAVSAALQVHWCAGMRFKMAFETEDSSRISWFMGTVAGVHAADPIRWKNSPWRQLQVSWDEPELLQNVKRVCPWLVELVSSMPNLHLPSFSPPRKKQRIPSYADFPLDGQLFHPPPPFPPNHPLAHDQLMHHHSFPVFPFPTNGGAPHLAGVQGARHPQFPPSFPDLRVTNLQQPSLPYSGTRRPAADHADPGISTVLTIGTSPVREDDAACILPKKAFDAAKAPPPPTLHLFGQAILTEEQMKSSGSCGSPNWEAEKVSEEGSGSGVIQGSPSNNNNTSSWRLGDSSSQSSSELGLEPGQCKVFVESDAVGRNLDLSALSSFEELYARMSDMFGIDGAELRSHVLYRGAAGEAKHVGDEPFRAFVKSARRLTILADAGSDNIGSS
ncbi:auxin response factor 10 [Lolium perenne]|uniref:auxin response factor 10 n=1 Tax=Lolium perenne TaxID=4522 RepID=UPI0021EA6B72|nr:auxin response factor 10-like [Lolium perenne]